MGKPKTQRSEESLSKAGDQMSGIKKLPMHVPKMGSQKRRRGRKTKNKIKKLFNQMRNTSCVTINSSIDNSVVILEDSNPNRKRKLSDGSFVEQNKRLIIEEPASLIGTDEVDAPNRVISRDTPVSISKPDNSIFYAEHNDEVIITNPVSFRTNSSLNMNDMTVISDAFQSYSNTPKKNLLHPINCSTPINNNNNDTIDLTTDTDTVVKTGSNTDIIDLDKVESQDCTFVSVSNASLSLSGESDVTVIRNSTSKHVNRFVNGISKLDASEKGRLLEMITQQIFSGCKVPEKGSSNISRVAQSANKETETIETSYIKQVILGQKPSRNSIGSNIYNPGRAQKHREGLRMIVIDGSNVAMTHGQGRSFSVKGLQICIDYFLQRGHEVKAFVPRFRCKFGKSTDPRRLDELERRGLVVYTPSREVQGRTITPYDDRYIVQCAAEFDAVVVTGDNYRDLHRENPRWRPVIENRLLPFTWVQDMIMFPRDPLGRNGPTLDEFLKHPVVKTVASIVL